jgi:hypothetical protein
MNVSLTSCLSEMQNDMKRNLVLRNSKQGFNRISCFTKSTVFNTQKCTTIDKCIHLEYGYSEGKSITNVKFLQHCRRICYM